MALLTLVVCSLKFKMAPNSQNLMKSTKSISCEVFFIQLQITSARCTELPLPFFKLSVYIFIFNQISLFLYYFISFFLILTCSCPYSCNLSNLHVLTLYIVAVNRKLKKGGKFHATSACALDLQFQRRIYVYAR